ncbi:MAG: hypothetical protein DCC55_01265 [Chloroflexi bacterium]|nr:MAG: hypothetical protein DCC55_01265 [Chloroflexota bacterium]
MLLDLLTSPLGPALVLLLGAGVLMLYGRWVRRADWLTALALLFVATAALLLYSLRERPVVPTFSLPWQPLLQSGTNFLWVGDGWNWYISGLILLLGGVGLLLDLNNEQAAERLRVYGTLAINLVMLAAALLFVSSGNLLTAIFTWVLLDIVVLVRNAPRLEQYLDGASSEDNYARGLSLVGALLLLIALLPAGPRGPSQEFQSGSLPVDAVLFVVLAAAIRAGIYPFHLWLIPHRHRMANISERLLEHLVPVLCGLWLLGWAFRLGNQAFWQRSEGIALLVLTLLGSAVAAWTAKQKAEHTTLVLITSANLAALAGALAFSDGPSAMIWPTTAFALGGALWLVGEQVWLVWGWQLPVSVGAATIIGLPFTPGFLTQPALARLLSPGTFYLVLFGIFVAAATLQVAALLRSWGGSERQELPAAAPGTISRLLVASVAIGLPLAVAGFLPRAVAALASMPDAIPPTLGDPPIVVAPLPVWITLALPLSAGIMLVWSLPQPRIFAKGWVDYVNQFVRLDWLFRLAWWGADRTSDIWANALRVVEGSGYMGWLAVLVLIGYLMMR